MSNQRFAEYFPICVARVFSLVLIASVVAHGQGKGKKNISPSVSITSPTNGSTFSAPTSIAIKTDASDPDGSVTKVEFFANGSLLGTVTTAPFDFTWSNVGGGSYSLTARATDNRNSKTTSNVVNVSVGAITPSPTAVSGSWGPLMDLPLTGTTCTTCRFQPIHMHLLANGKILMWQDDNPNGGRSSGADTVAYVWDMAANTFAPVTNVNTDVFCSGHAFLPDGRLLVAGGHNQSDNNGTTTTNLFDPTTNSWSLSSFQMNAGRWYPTVTTLSNGDMLVVSGNITTTQGVNTIPEVWQTGAGGGWRQLTSAALSQPLYPWMHVAPNGKVFNSGPDASSRYLDTAGAGAWTFVAGHLSPSTRDYGSSVMYGDGKVLVVGGGDPPTNSAEIIDLTSSSPVWQQTGSMNWARRQMSATLLPDGTVLALGGSSSGGFNDATLAVLAAELWNPATGQWSVMARMQVPRMYHSNALLLPDGRVVSAGGGRPAATGTTDQPNAQIYSPPYLFNTDGSLATRPAISSVRTELNYGQSFSISTPDAANVTAVTLVRLGSFTHSFDQNQRFNRLTFTTSAGALNAIAPASGTSCPPGHYMLFILINGVPSVAKIVHLT